MADELTPIKVSLARIEERQEAYLYRILNMDMKIDGLAAKVELRPCKEDIAQIITPLKERVDRVENTQTWLLRSGVASISVLTAGIAAISKKIGLV